MKKIYAFALAVLVCSGIRLAAQTPTWADDVAPILYGNCTKCHNPSGIAPFPLITYNDASSMSFFIGNAVSAGVMPPWPPDTNYTRLSHERILTSSERQAILDWVNGGTPQGNLANAPTPPVYTGASEIISPDLTLAMPTYTVASAQDIYRCFVIPTNTTQNEYITEIEVLPGNRSIVHHVLVFQDQSSLPALLDANDPGPGYTNFGGTGSPTSTLVTGWVPGQGKFTLPANMGIQLQQNTNLILQIHYPAGAIGQTDSTKVNMKFSTGTVRNVTLNAVLNHDVNMTNGPLYIPADSITTFYEQETATINATVLTVAPHMHLIGRSIKSWAITPNQDTIPFISIPSWNFMWQGFYNFYRLIHVPLGSQLYAEAVYDNTSSNTYNPNNPPQDVPAGESTTDEMMIVYFAYTNYQPGDENIIVDSTILSTPPAPISDIAKTVQLYDPYPSPAKDQVNVQYFLPQPGNITFELVDITGKQLMVLASGNQNSGFGTNTINVQSLAAGTYFLKLTHNGITRTKKIVKQ